MLRWLAILFHYILNVEKFAYEVNLDNTAVQEMKMLNVLRNGTVSPEIGNVNVYVLQINYSIGTCKVDVDGMSINLSKRDEKSWGVPIPAGVAEFHTLVTGCVLSPNQTSI